MTMIHYLSHRVGWLWKFHSIHHGVSRLYGLNGFVRHPLHQAMDVTFGTLPLVIAGLPVPVAAALGTAIAIQLRLAACQCELRDRTACRNCCPSARCTGCTMSIGRGDGDVNFGLFRLYGTGRSAPSSRVRTGRPAVADIGIQDCPHFPQNYARQLRIPFERGSPCEPAGIADCGT